MKLMVKQRARVIMIAMPIASFCAVVSHWRVPTMSTEVVDRSISLAISTASYLFSSKMWNHSMKTVTHKEITIWQTAWIEGCVKQ